MAMRRVIVVTGLAFWALGLGAAEYGRQENGTAAPTAQERTSIRMGRSTAARSGTLSKAQGSAGAASSQASWGHLSLPTTGKPAAKGGATASTVPARPAQGVLAAHRNTYARSYVARSLSKVGVTKAPAFVADRNELVQADRGRSLVKAPVKGPTGAAITARPLLPKAGDRDLVRGQMDRINTGEWFDNVDSFNRIETEKGRYYWHRDHGFDYCHYVDKDGSHWYGWYLNGGYFWTRCLNGRWWWYDAVASRWDFYNDGKWWWQDPYHVADLYCYDEGSYVPANVPGDLAVEREEAAQGKDYTSPDGARTVRVESDGKDAYLVDPSANPSFQPVYLASGVQNVQFSDPGNGRPLEILLTLADGSFDIFNADGRAYAPGEKDAEAEQDALANSAQ